MDDKQLVERTERLTNDFFKLRIEMLNHRRTLAIFLTILLILVLVNISFGQPRPVPATTPVVTSVAVGDTAKNLRVLPAWTMRQCRVASKGWDLRAAYDSNGAIKLRMVDETCGACQQATKLYQDQVTDLMTRNKYMTVALGHGDKALALGDKRQEKLVAQLVKEIEEKNKYKYQPDYKWVYIAVGVGVALLGLGFGGGAYLASD